MGRLTEIIKEQQDPQINNRSYHLYSGIGNLFNLMMIVNPENPFPFPIDAHISIVSKMLSDLEDAKSVKGLQTYFNKIKATIKQGKIPKADIKKKYFLLLFNLMKSETGLKLNPTTLSNKFAAGGQTGAAKQKPEIIKIGKALLTNLKSDLNEKDKKIIKIFISHLSGESVENETSEEPVKNTEPETKSTEQPITPEIVDEVEKEMTNKTEEQLQDISTKSDTIISSVKAQNVDNSVELGGLLKTNEDPNKFKVEFTDSDQQAGEIINKKIIENHKKLAAEYNLETANFISKLTQDMFEQIDKNVNGYLNHFQNDITIDIKTTDKGLEFTTVVGPDDKYNVERFKVHQVFNIDQKDGKSNVYFDHIQIPSSQQKLGIYKDIFRENLNTYKAQGIEKISLIANVDVGGYAWFRFGFMPTDEKEIKHIANWMKNESNRFAEAINTDKESLIQHIESNSSDTTTNKTILFPEVSNLVEFIKENDQKVVAPVIMELVKRCAEEFEKAFDEKSKFKNINEYISTKIFTPQMINGFDKPITISCKTLLTLYAIKDINSEYEGSKVIPVPATGYLGWKGELMLDNLDDTYAYLNLK